MIKTMKEIMQLPETLKEALAYKIAERLHGGYDTYNSHMWWSNEPVEHKAKEVKTVLDVIQSCYDELELEEEGKYQTLVQDWGTYTRYLFVHEHGSLQLNLYNEIQDDGISAFIYNLYVDLDYRKQGIGSMLMEAAEKIAKEKGYSHITLGWERKDSSEEVLKWYYKRGYKEIGNFRKESYTLEKDFMNNYLTPDGDYDLREITDKNKFLKITGDAIEKEGLDNVVLTVKKDEE